MKTLLENLWTEYQIEKNRDISDERKVLLHELVVKQKELHSKLNDDQIRLLEEYEECDSRLNCATEKDSFIQGVSFAVSFILEAMK